MGTERLQPLTLICNYPAGKLYTLQADLTGLKILDVEESAWIGRWLIAL